MYLLLFPLPYIIYTSCAPPLEVTNIKENTPLSVQMKPFWASTKNKEKYQVPSRKIFQRVSENDSIKVVLSGNVTGGKDASPCVECING